MASKREAVLEDMSDAVVKLVIERYSKKSIPEWNPLPVSVNLVVCCKCYVPVTWIQVKVAHVYWTGGRALGVHVSY